MHRIDDSEYLLYIEPSASEKLSEPIDDIYTTAVQYAVDNATKGTANYSNRKDHRNFSATSGGWMGHHQTECGERSTCWDYLLGNGMITNSLAPFYVRWYRNSIPPSEMQKLESLLTWFKTKIQ